MEYIVLSIIVILFFIGFYSTNYELQRFMHSLGGKFIVVSILASVSYVYGIRSALVSSVLVVLYYNYSNIEGFSTQDEEAVANTDEDATVDTSSQKEDEDSSSVSNDTTEQSTTPTTGEPEDDVPQSGANADVLSNDPKDPSNYKNSVNPDDESPTTHTQASNGPNQTKEVVPMPSKTTEGFSLLY